MVENMQAWWNWKGKNKILWRYFKRISSKVEVNSIPEFKKIGHRNNSASKNYKLIKVYHYTVRPL